jgi:putative ABC transport system permease protein
MYIQQNIRHSLRLLARNPGFTFAAVLTLAVALGANTAVFSLMNGVVYRALPYSEPDRIADVSILVPPGEGRPSRKELLDSQRLAAWQRSSRTVTLAAYSGQSFTMSGQGEPERLAGARVSTALFSLLRVAPTLGRTFLDEERRPGQDRVVVLSNGFWQKRFQSDPRIVGQSMVLDGAAYTIVGVMPRGFFFPSHDEQLWTPLTETPAVENSINVQYFPVVARLKDGISPAQAEAEAEAIFQGLAASEPLAGKVRIVPLRDEIVAGVRPAIVAMFAAVGLVLLLACINLANLLLARSSARQREMAIRSAVGGTRGRLVRQLLTESLILSLAGGLAGLLLAVWIHRLLPSVLPRDIPRIEEVQLDPRVFLFAFLLSGLTGLVFGLVPALRSSGNNLVRPLQGGTAEASPAPPSQSLFVVAQVALAFILLVGAGLLLRSFVNLMRVELGFEPEHVLTATLDLDPHRYGAPGRGEAFFDEILSRLEKRQGVRAAGVVSFPPLTPGFSLTSLEIVGQPPARTMAVPQLSSPGYLHAMGLRLASGRWLNELDHATQAPVAIVNQAFVRRYLAGQNPLGQRLKVGSATLEIVGALKDARLLGPTADPKPELFTSFHQAGKVTGMGPKRLTLVLRTAGDPTALVPFLREAAFDLDPNLALEDVRTMDARLSASVAQPRFYALLLGVFAGLALVLASAGVYGVLSYSVSRQTRAIGVRRALGAGSGVILAMVLRKGFVLVFLGLLIGLAGALGASRVIAQLLFGVTTRDPLSYLIAALPLVVLTVLACYLPARRATLVEPMEALRYDR